jgi:hypothetical protein
MEHLRDNGETSISLHLPVLLLPILLRQVFTEDPRRNSLVLALRPCFRSHLLFFITVFDFISNCGFNDNCQKLN